VEEGAKHLDSELQEIYQSIVKENIDKVDSDLTILQGNQYQMLEEQGKNFDRTLKWMDNSMQNLLDETKKKDTDIILQAQENNFNKALNLIMNSFNGLTREIRSTKNPIVLTI
jgi:hypothetical protein